MRISDWSSDVCSSDLGPGTRANIDEFTETTSLAIVEVGGAVRGKAIIVLNPAEPPLIMRDTVYCLTAPAEPEKIVQAVETMVSRSEEHTSELQSLMRISYAVFCLKKKTKKKIIKTTIIHNTQQHNKHR